MAIFKVEISREYKEWEGAIRYIEAPDAAEALRLGNLLGEQFEDDVPDDVAIIDGSYDNSDGTFAASTPEEVAATDDESSPLTAADIEEDAG